MVTKPWRTTILIAPETRDGLKHIARKDQSYNDLLQDLILMFEKQRAIGEAKDK
jgi:hypothetical protein